MTEQSNGKIARRIRSAIPRGFSRYYIINLLKERSMTGKELMDEAGERSEGAWMPSPGLIYPLLGRLLSEGLIEEDKEGRYRITERGVEVLGQYSQVQEEVHKQLEVIIKLGLAGKFAFQNIVDRMIGLSSMISENLDKLGARQRARYKAFLQRELERLEQEERR